MGLIIDIRGKAFKSWMLTFVSPLKDHEAGSLKLILCTSQPRLKPHHYRSLDLVIFLKSREEGIFRIRGVVGALLRFYLQDHSSKRRLRLDLCEFRPVQECLFLLLLTLLAKLPSSGLSSRKRLPRNLCFFNRVLLGYWLF